MKSKFTNALEFFKNTANSVFLVPDIWKENTTAIIHGPREADKTPAAIDIARDLTASGREVLYVDTRSRLIDYAKLIKNEDRLSIFIPAYDSPDDPADYADLVIAGIEEAITTTSIRTFIVDSVTRIAALSFGRNASAAYVMKRLVSLQMRHGLSLLVVTRPASRAVERALSCLADSTFTTDSPETGTDAQSAKESRILSCANSQPDAQRPETCAEKPTPSSDSVRQCQTAPDSKAPKTKAPEPRHHDFQPLCEYYFDEGRAWKAPDLYATL